MTDMQTGKWEYQALVAGSEAEILNAMNEAGQAGWELVAVHPHGVEGWTAFLKRPNTGEPPKSLLPDTAKIAADTAKKAAAEAAKPKPVKKPEPAAFDVGDDTFELQL